ncbi:carbohydrate-binding module family 13 protein [Mycena metata]|uniref:Carbohydrate-binding module family 13 protein n=1 Tax=Mycena metata TaxID=1033252 RepID=A0AAD7MIT9_9AGAR|nr:carbohydrate-binding module family 13 protein [Mycena metata]
MSQPPSRGNTSALCVDPGLNAGKCLTAASNTDGAIVTLQPCTGSTEQKWTITGGSVKLFGDTKCLDVTGESTTNGNQLQIWTCSTNNNPNQRLYFTDDDHLRWTNHGKCVDLADGSLASGDRPELGDCSGTNANQVRKVGYSANALPATSESGQSGTNACGSGQSQTSKCQTAWINSATDFCLWAPPSAGRGTRTIPNGTLKGVHFVTTPDYVQVTGKGDFTKINAKAGDEGGELDPHGADGNGNPIGGLVFGDTFGAAQQSHEWTSFISDTEFCFRACVGPNAARNCQHIYDVMGCYWNMPANYDSGTYENCDADNDLPMGVYGTSTWHQGTSPTPTAH